MAIQSFRQAGLPNTNTISLLQADFSNTATGTYSSSGIDYKYVRFTANGTLTITSDGVADVLVVGGGGGGYSGGGAQAAGSSGLALYIPGVYLPAGSHTVTIGSGGGSTANGNTSSLNITTWTFSAGGGSGAVVVGGSNASYSWPGGKGGRVVTVHVSGYTYPAGQAGTLDNAGLTSSITGSSVLYAGPVGWADGTAPANTGRGGDGNAAQTGAAGVVIVRVRTN